MANLKSSFAISFLQKYSELLIGFISSVILARILMPEEVGLYSVVASVVVLAHMVRDFGVSSYLVQEKNLSEEKLSSAFYVTLGLSYFSGFLLLILAPWISGFFEREEVLNIVRVVSIIFFVIPFGSVRLSLLRRDMKFGVLFKINISSALIGAISTVFLAFQGLSYMSLVWGSVIGTVSTVIFSYFLGPRLVHKLPKKDDFLDVLSFGWKVSTNMSLLMLVNQVPDILIGKLFGMTSAGLYSRASGLVKIFHMGFMQGVIPVILPHFVNTINKGGDIKKVYFRSLSILCTFSWSFFVFLALMSEDIITVLYGANWIEANYFVVWLAVAAAVASIYSLNNHIFIATKKVEEDLKNQVISQLISVAVLVYSSSYGLQYMMFGWVLSRIVSMLLSYYFMSRVLGSTWIDLIKSLSKPLLLSALVIISFWFWLSLGFVGELGLILKLISSSVVFCGVWAFFVFVLRMDILDVLFKKEA